MEVERSVWVGASSEPHVNEAKPGEWAQYAMYKRWQQSDPEELSDITFSDYLSMVELFQKKGLAPPAKEDDKQAGMN